MLNGYKEWKVKKKERKKIKKILISKQSFHAYQQARTYSNHNMFTKITSRLRPNVCTRLVLFYTLTMNIPIYYYYHEYRSHHGVRFGVFFFFQMQTFCVCVSTSSPSLFVYILRVHNREIDNNVHNISVWIIHKKLFTTARALKYKYIATAHIHHSPSTSIPLLNRNQKLNERMSSLTKGRRLGEWSDFISCQLHCRSHANQFGFSRAIFKQR